MVDTLLNMALFGGEPILYLLLGLSLVSVAIIIERAVVHARNRIDLAGFTADMVRLLNQGDVEGAREAAGTLRAAEARVVAEGLANFDRGALVAGELMKSARIRQQQLLDRRLIVLGTVGSNAPFIGLLGTVLGIIKAFNDLAFAAKAGPSVVMAGISEALVATAVGLLVAIPAVIAFNYFKNRQKTVMENVDQLENTLLAFMGTREQSGVRAVSGAAPRASDVA